MVCDAAEVSSRPVRTATARLCTVKTLVGPTAVALMLLVDRTSGHLFLQNAITNYIYRQ